MVAEVCRAVNNYFEKNGHGKKQIYRGRFVINGGQIISSLDFLQDGQYFRITGSTFNDGVYRKPASGLENETFDGAIWAMSIPPDFIALCSDINKWQTENGEKVNSLYDSESIPNYSYSKSKDPKTGGNFTWESAFSSRLDRWRKQ